MHKITELVKKISIITKGINSNNVRKPQPKCLAGNIKIMKKTNKQGDQKTNYKLFSDS